MSIIRTHNITLYGGNDKYKIILRPLSDEYLPYLYKWNADPEVLYWTEGGEDICRSYSPETVHQIYGGIELPQGQKGKLQYHWRMTRKEFEAWRDK